MILNLTNPIFQKKLSTLEPTDLELINLANRFKRFDSIADIFMFDPELLQFGAEIGFVELGWRR